MKLALILLLLLVIGLGMIHFIPSRAADNVQDDPPTAIQSAIITKKQRKHSELYNSYKGSGNLRELVINTPGDEITITALPGMPELSPTGETAASALDFIVDHADAIVIGVVSEKSSQLNEKGTFIFTDYEFAIEEVLKDNPQAHIDPNVPITITRPGGKILLNSKTVTAIDRSHRPLKIGKRYLLILQFIPATGAYKALDNKSSFQINDKITVLTDDPVPLELQGDRDAYLFLDQVRSSIAAYKRRKGGINQ